MAGVRPSVLKYVRVRDYLRSLVTHELRVGDAIPSERLLCERFGVSRMTVRQAVDALVVEGLLEREQGRGTFVAPAKVDLQVRLASFGEEMARRGMVASSRVIAAEEVAATPDVADALELLPGDPVHHLHRVRYADGEPMAIEQSWGPRLLVPALFELGPPASSRTGVRTRSPRPRSTPRALPCSVCGQALRCSGSRGGRSPGRRRASTPGPPTARTGTCCGSRCALRDVP